ncbi:MAG: response regulator [Candidatus Thorarchaeota archaeon]|nr:response regulator [Candidatus Thorarchaeota archaeon]
MKIRVLVVDDDEDLLFLASKFLEKEDERFELIGVNTDQEALQKLEEEKFDAIVCDHYLGPHSRTGLDLLEWVREANPHIPFIILTGRSQEAVAIRALNLGADYYLKKGDDEVRELFSQIAVRIISEVEQRRSEEALEAAYADLENRVAERTAELEEMNQRLLHEINERRKVEHSLILQQELGNTLCKATNLTDALDGILKTVVQLEGIDSGGIYLIDGRTGKFDVSSSQGLSSHFLYNFYKETGETSIDKPVYLTMRDIQNSKTIEEQYKNLTAVAFLPVTSEDRTVAILSLASHTHDEIPERNRRTLEAISIQIAAYMTRINAENSILDSKAGLTLVSELSDDLFLIIGSDHKIVYANKKTLDRLNVSMDVLLKKTIQDIYRGVDIEKIKTDIENANEGSIVRSDISIAVNNEIKINATAKIRKGKYEGRDAFFILAREVDSQ